MLRNGIGAEILSGYYRQDAKARQLNKSKNKFKGICNKYVKTKLYSYICRLNNLKNISHEIKCST